MNKTNNVLLIVEGKSDEEALFAISEYNRHHNASSNEKPEIIIIPTNRDMLTALTDEEDGREPILKEDCMKLILKTIRNQLEAKCAEAKIKVSQISKAMYLTDMDGVYIDNSNIIQDKTISYCDEKQDDDVATYYMEKNILSPFPKRIINRNWRKRTNIQYLLNMPEIELNTGGKKARVPFEMFYMACNLEHNTINNQNYGEDKPDAAFDWAHNITMSKDPEKNIRRFFESLLPTGPTYKDTWQYITTPKTNRSLERSSNWLLILDELDQMADSTR